MIQPSLQQEEYALLLTLYSWRFNNNKTTFLLIINSLPWGDILVNVRSECQDCKERQEEIGILWTTATKIFTFWLYPTDEGEKI